MRIALAEKEEIEQTGDFRKRDALKARP